MEYTAELGSNIKPNFIEAAKKLKECIMWVEEELKKIEG
jgi:hypothetical protein